MKATITIQPEDLVTGVASNPVTAIIGFDIIYLKGDKGNSAYEDAVEQGYVGTLEQWLASLQGTAGISPSISVTSIQGGHRVTIFDEDHPQGQSFDVMDGQGGGGGTVTADIAPTQGSTNPVQSGGVYSALLGKQDSLSVLTSQELETGTSTTARSISAKVLKDYLSETIGDINTVLESLLGNNDVQ